MKVNQLSDFWPPVPGYFGSGVPAPLPGQVAFKNVKGVVGRGVIFVCTLVKEEYHYSFEAPDELTARKLEAILGKSVGIDLLSIGMMEIPED